MALSVKDVVIIVLCILLPFIAVLIMGLDREWDGKKLLIYVLIAFVLTCIFWIPGIIFAFLVYVEFL
jgi:uncharacterized membrane protein YqaE (UPF0057 family)